ncbi:MAG TPA: heavy metal-binding domain-containing protein [Phycisphaerales bacterium]|nr:heavy metal-binding domain-containing protein [Phycisphaerales bacterium]
MAVMTGLSGNEMYCLHLKGMSPGDIVVGNSVFSVGFLGSIGAGLRTLAGGEVSEITEIIHAGRQTALERMVKEAEDRGGVGITGVSSELIQHGGNVEFLSIGSNVHEEGASGEKLGFSSSADGQELYCQIDAGFTPRKFAFGNVAYSIGIGGGIMGSLRGLARGEVKEYSEIFNRTRHLALERISADAKSAGANAVVGIETSIVPFRGMQEMVMIGTASRHGSLETSADATPITSDLTCEEMWNLVHMGYMPVRLLLGVSVYSLGVVGGLVSAFKSFVRGEITELSRLVYEARHNALERIARDAEACGADDVVGIKCHVYQLGGSIIEFLAIGTAVKRIPGLTTLSETLPPQAVIRDKDTFINTAEMTLGKDLNKGMES